MSVARSLRYWFGAPVFADERACAEIIRGQEQDQQYRTYTYMESGDGKGGQLQRKLQYFFVDPYLALLKIEQRSMVRAKIAMLEIAGFLEDDFSGSDNSSSDEDSGDELDA
jgi:hypothetical protein